MAHLFQEGFIKRRPSAAAVAKGRGRGGDFGSRLAEAAGAAIADARRALTDSAFSQPEAVHSLRKAFKRWRALLRLLRASVGAPAEEMRIKARSLMRELSGARDAQGALDALDDLAGHVPISRTSLRALHARVATLRDAAENAAFTPELRERIGHYLDDAALAIERWNVDGIAFDTIADALTATYCRARKLVPQNWHQVRPGELHELRRRVVEHRHQMDVVEPLWPRLGKLWANEAQRLRTHLGGCQDLGVLSHFMEPHQPLAPWRSRFTPAIVSRRTAHLRTAERVAGRLFAEKPKAFRNRIAALRDARENRMRNGR